MRPRLSNALLLIALVATAGACSVPADTSHYDFVPPDAGPSLALGAACDGEHPCGEGFVCRVPAECRRTDPEVVPSSDLPGGRAGDGCDDARPCADGHVCEPLSETALCTRDCEGDADCPADAVCWSDRGPAEHSCVRPGGLLGAACEAENDCAPGLFCENRASGGYCSKICDAGVPCPAGMGAICTRLSGEFGVYCLQRCTADRDACRDDITCRKMTKADEYVCFPEF